jgi:hypothetical protein
VFIRLCEFCKFKNVFNIFIQFFQKYGLPLLKYVIFFVKLVLLVKSIYFLSCYLQTQGSFQTAFGKVEYCLDFFYSAQNDPFDLLQIKNITVKISNCVFEE